MAKKIILDKEREAQRKKDMEMSGKQWEKAHKDKTAKKTIKKSVKKK